MTLNELMTKQNFLVKILLRQGDAELSKELKIKVMSMRIEFSKVRTQFEKDMQDVLEQLKPEGYDNLAQKPDRSKEEEDELAKINAKITEEYNEFAISKGKEEITLKENTPTTLSDDEFNQIVEVNAGNDVEINGTKLQAADFLEILYSLFVE